MEEENGEWKNQYTGRQQDSEIGLRAQAVGSCERGEIQDRYGDAEGSWDVGKAKHEMFIFSGDEANQAEADL